MQKKLLILSLLFLISVILTGCTTPEPNSEPIITSTPVTTASVGVIYTYDVNATDSDEDTLTYTLTTPPTGMTINSSTGLISWTPTEDGVYPITVKVSDGKSIDTQSFTITVSLGATTSRRVVMAELFVGPACGRCPDAKIAMATLLQEYGFDKLVVLEEYGFDKPLSSGWSTPEIINRWKDYRKLLGISDGLTPDAYFNGLNQVANYNQSPYYYKYKSAIEAELAKAPKVSISASRSIAGSPVNISGRISNISSETLSNIVIEAMVYEDNVPLVVPDTTIDTIVNHVVRDIVTYDESGGEEMIDSFAPGESYEFSLTSSYLSNVQNMNNIHVVVYVQAPNSSTKEILQALYVE